MTHRLIRYSLRDIFWLTLVVAVNLGWHTFKVAPVRDLERTIDRQNAEIEAYSEKVEDARKANNRLSDSYTEALLNQARTEEEFRQLRAKMRSVESQAESVLAGEKTS